ncbi:MAG: DUF5684 domain-containing protein, partial [Candidatus Omnitrophica bacterium]|nr:DUF5684 domain-containing protein [Candidatus Omnitrophota bacterium]
QNPFAIVNGASVKIGDSVKGVRVTGITDSLVTFEYNSETFSKRVGEKCARETIAPKKELKTTPAVPSEMLTPQKIPPKVFSRRTGTLHRSAANTRQIESLMRAFSSAILILVLIAYVYSAIVVQKIAHKTNTENGWLAWIPIANLFLLCSIAGKSFLWILIVFVPFVGVIIFTIVIWGGIAQACGKPGWLGILMLLPVVSLIVVTYLAFSKIKLVNTEEKESPVDPLQHIAHPERNPMEPRP